MMASAFPFSVSRARVRLRVVVAAVALIAGVAAGTGSPAEAQDVQSLAETVSRLERQLQTLERNVYRSGGARPAPTSSPPVASGGGGTPAGAAQLNVRIGEIEEQLRQVTGDVEKIGFEVRQLASRLDKLVTDVDYRLRTLEQGASANVAAAQPATEGKPAGAAPASSAGAAQPGTLGTLTESQLRAANAAPSAAPPAGQVATVPPAGQAAATGGTVSLPAVEPAAQYEYAFSYLMRRDFPGAEEAFRQFLAANPEDSRAGNAQYWLGETYYARNDFETAARVFAEGWQRYPGSNKAPDNLLKLGLSLVALGRKDDACITFAKLASDYPGAPANILQHAKRERAKLSCG
jgi:tol-pal system protein YbgF